MMIGNDRENSLNPEQSPVLQDNAGSDQDWAYVLGGQVDAEARNAEIYSLRQDGHTMRELAIKYSLSPEWIRRICEDQERRVKADVGKTYPAEKTEVYLLIPGRGDIEASELCGHMDRMEKLPLHVYHCVCSKETQDGNESHSGVEYFRKLTDDEIRDPHGAGRVIQAFLDKVKKEI